MTRVDALRRAAERTVTEADRLSAIFAQQLAKVFRETDRALREWLQEQGPRPTPSARAHIRRIVRTAGFDELAVRATGQPFNDITSRTLAARRVAQGAVNDSLAAAAKLEAWRDWHLDDLLDEGTVLTRSLGDAVMRGVGRSRRRLPNDLTEILDRSEARIATLYDTAVSIYGRQVEAEQAGDEATTPFVYMGPVDAKTRDFCLEHVGKVYTRSEIDELDNGQLSNVFLTGGGYNCRHVWHEVSKFSELLELGEAPEIRQDVIALQEDKAA